MPQIQPEEKENLLKKLGTSAETIMSNTNSHNNAYNDSLTAEELRVVNHLRARRVEDTGSTSDLDSVGTYVIESRFGHANKNI